MKKQIILFLTVLLICMSCHAEGLLPKLTDVYGMELPRFGNAIGRDADHEETDENGTLTQTYLDVSEEEYSIISEYLERKNCEMAGYSVHDGVLTAELTNDGFSFTMSYDAKNGIVIVSYPNGTFPEPTAAPFDVNAGIGAISADSDPADILAVQMKLYQYGLLDPDAITQGVLDTATLECIAQFQRMANETMGLELTILDPETAVSVDVEAVKALLYGEDTLSSTKAIQDISPIVVPFGEPITLETQILMDGSARRDTSNADFETLNLTVQILSYKDFDYFEKNYSDIYDLKGGTAAAEFNITLNNYTGTQRIIPQNCLQITLRGDTDTKTTPGYQLIDKEMAGSTGVMLVNNQPITLYKRYAYDKALGEMKYMVLNTYNDGVETTYWFDIDMPESNPASTPEPTPEPDVSKTLYPGETGDAIKQMQETLIAQGYLDAEATGYYGEKTTEAVKAAQKAFGLTEDGVAGKQFFSKLYDMEID